MHRKFITILCLGAVCAFGERERVTAFFAAGPNGIVRSLDAGATWEPANNGLASFAIRALAGNRSGRPVVYAAGPGSVYRTDDLGSTWVRILSDVAVSKLAVSPTDPDVVYALASGALWKTIDGGNTWGTFETPGLVTIEPDFHRSNRLFGATKPDRGNALFYYSDDGGASWNAGAPATWLQPVLAADPIAPDHLYTNSFDAVLQSTDAGRSWKIFEAAEVMLGEPPPGTLAILWRGFDRTSAMIADPVRFGDIYACVVEEADSIPWIIYDLDWFIARVRGKWKKLSPPDGGCASLVPDPNSEGVLYAAGAGLFRLNVDEGGSWTPVLGDRKNPVTAVVAVSVERERPGAAGVSYAPWRLQPAMSGNCCGNRAGATRR